MRLFGIIYTEKQEQNLLEYPYNAHQEIDLRGLFRSLQTELRISV